MLMFRDIDVTPSSTNIIFWADYIELRALLEEDRNFVKADFEKVLGENRDSASEKWRDALNLALARVAYFGDAYPFKIPEDESDIIILKQDLDDAAKSYLSLLLFSSLKYIEKTYVNGLAREFEILSSRAFLSCMPSGSIVKANWAQPGVDDNCYRGTLPEKLRAIANDIRCSTDGGIVDADYDARDSGDGGIDLVAWHAMYDKREGIPIAMGQCSCSKTEWKLKQVEAIYYKHQQVLPVAHAWANYYFCPLDLRKTEATWHFGRDIGGAIIIDRFRLISIMRNSGDWYVSPIIKGLTADQLEAA